MSTAADSCARPRMRRTRSAPAWTAAPPSSSSSACATWCTLQTLLALYGTAVALPWCLLGSTQSCCSLPKWQLACTPCSRTAERCHTLPVVSRALVAAASGHACAQQQPLLQARASTVMPVCGQGHMAQSTMLMSLLQPAPEVRCLACVHARVLACMPCMQGLQMRVQADLQRGTPHARKLSVLLLRCTSCSTTSCCSAKARSNALPWLSPDHAICPEQLDD